MRVEDKTVPPEQLKKVARCMDLYDRIQAFKADHYEIFQEFAQLLQDYNDAIEDAEKEVRAYGVSSGPFVVCGEVSRVDVDKLYDELGEEDFVRVGGQVETKRVLSIDKKRFESLADSGAVPKEVVSAVLVRTLKFKVPGKAELP